MNKLEALVLERDCLLKEVSEYAKARNEARPMVEELAGCPCAYVGCSTIRCPGCMSCQARAWRKKHFPKEEE